ncbi:zinc ribbon domain-containing protein [Alkalicoccobacillus murimartini]|uniref:RNA polymerase subunit RPABC4/transcription elongation factor Spt4 n=1 Tax=Alkalicoccobacillus murimartini TaxID=171685 RepID=A0ABT9YGJ2_9BACI|nr:zinc ribbon domain-containing protein [Alkalicoccobacillus murimartini]MDQ0206945.1 RNA polymerase subunit RPABC4/transcription elongation factor Spt4 [Alkalicoccobacillus murimartini]
MTTGWKDKVGEGLSKVQGGIDQGKQKFQTSQEMMKIKREIQGKSAEKAEVLLQLGQKAYEKLRAGALLDEDLQSLSSQIVAHDTFVYQKSKELSVLSEESKLGVVCTQCHKENDANASFCGGCGSELVVEEKVDPTALVACGTCSESMPETSNFCPCCGTAATHQNNV